eukprot:9159931-Pyramimonas_sp.AAC.1
MRKLVESLWDLPGVADDLDAIMEVEGLHEALQSASEPDPVHLLECVRRRLGAEGAARLLQKVGSTAAARLAGGDPAGGVPRGAARLHHVGGPGAAGRVRVGGAARPGGGARQGGAGAGAAAGGVQAEQEALDESDQHAREVVPGTGDQ